MPETSASPSPQEALTIISVVLPVIGLAVNSTPATSDEIIVWMTTEIWAAFWSKPRVARPRP